MADIQFEFSGEASEFLKDLRRIRQEFVDIKTANESAKKEMAEMLQQGVKDTDRMTSELAKSLKIQQEQKVLIEEMTKKMAELEKSKASAMDSDVVKKLKQQISQLEKELLLLVAGTKKFGDEGKKGTQMVSQSMMMLIGVIDAAKVKLASLTPDSGEYRKLAAEIKAAELAMGAFKDEVSDDDGKLDSGRKKLTEFQTALQNLKLNGLDNTEVYKNLRQEAGKLSDTISDVQEEIKAVGSDTAGIDQFVRSVQLATGVAGAYEGIVALAGRRNEDFERTLLRLNAVMAISTSLQSVMTELKRKDSVVTLGRIALQRLWTTAIGQTTGAMRILRTVMATLGIGLVIAGIGLLIANIDKVKNALGMTNPVVDRFKSGLDELKKTAPEVAEKIKEIGDSAQTIAEGSIRNLKSEIDSLNKELGVKVPDNVEIALAALKLLQEENVGLGEKLIDSVGFSTMNPVAGFFAELVGLKDSAEDIGKEMQRNLEQQNELQQRIEQLRSLRQQKAFADDLKAQKEANSKRIEEAKKLNERLLQLERELASARIAEMENGRQKDILLEQIDFNNRKADLEKRALGASAKERELINQLIEQEQLNHNARMMAIDIKYYDDAADAYKKAQETIFNILLNDQELEEHQLIKQYESIFLQIEEARKKNLELLTDPIDIEAVNVAADNQIAKVTEQLNKERLAITKKYSLFQIEEAEKLAMAQNDILRISGLDQEQLEQVKEVNRLNILIEFAQKRLGILRASGEDENALQIAQLEKVIQDAEAKLKEFGEKDSFFSFAKFLGMDEEALSVASNNMAAALAEIFRAREIAVQKEIDLIDRKIRALDEEVTAQEDAVERERELMEEGYANNYELEQRRLEEAKARQAEELKNKEAAQKKLEEIRKREAAVQAASNAAGMVEQTVNLGVAASNVFKAHSGIPFVGVILALAAVASMVAGFLSIKNAISSATRAKTGKRIAKGKSHDQGGNKYISMDGNDPDIVEIEEGEWVVNKKSSEKYDPLLDAINSDKLDRMSRPQLKRLLEPLGIKLQSDFPEKVLREKNSSQVIVTSDGSTSKELQKQNEYLKKIAENTDIQTEYVEGYRIEKRGNRIRKIKIS